MTYHVFSPSRTANEDCAYCRHKQSEHKCDVCDRATHPVTNSITNETKEKELPVILQYGNMLFCQECWEKEQKMEAENKANASKRVEELESNRVNDAIAQSRQIDSTIQARTDLFNAATVAIVELKTAIDSDANITNKPYALAEELMNRFQHYKQVIFDYNQKIIEAGNQQKAIQVYLNQLANQLREEERAKLKINDINYKPTAPKLDKTKPVKTAKGKIDKDELRKYAAELGIPEFTLQMLVVSKGITVATAAGILKRKMEEMKEGE